MSDKLPRPNRRLLEDAIRFVAHRPAQRPELGSLPNEHQEQLLAAARRWLRIEEEQDE